MKRMNQKYGRKIVNIRLGGHDTFPLIHFSFTNINFELRTRLFEHFWDFNLTWSIAISLPKNLDGLKCIYFNIQHHMSKVP